MDCSFLSLQILSIPQSSWQQAPAMERVAGKESKVRSRRKQTDWGVGGAEEGAEFLHVLSQCPQNSLSNISYHCITTTRILLHTLPFLGCLLRKQLDHTLVQKSLPIPPFLGLCSSEVLRTELFKMPWPTTSQGCCARCF